MTADVKGAPAPNAGAWPTLSPSSSEESLPAPRLGGATTGGARGRAVSDASHPAGKAKHGRLRQFTRAASFTLYFVSGCIM